MAKHKKHHYVPRFYLKLFSQNGRSINLFNIRSQRSVIDGGLKNQCYRDFFYGKDLQTENALSLVEGQMSRILNAVQSNCVLPSRRSEDRITFLLHVLMQHTRTAYAIDAYDEQIDKFMKYLMAPKMKEMNLSPEQISSIKITQKDSARLVLGMATPYYPLLIDLEWKILRATGTHEFITSDNPVVYYNQFFSFRKLGSNTGLASKGLLIFFPVGPKHLVVLYDGKVYGVGSKKCDVVDISEVRDIKQLNRLQFVSALENVYFLDKSFPVFQDFRASEHYRRPQKSQMQVFLGEETSENQEELLMMSREDVRTDLELSFLRILKPAKEWRRAFQAMSPQPVVVVRNEQLMKDHEDFMKLADAKRYKYSEFFKYVCERYPTS